MDVTTAIGLLVVAILVLIVLYTLVKLGARYGKYLAVNSILGIIVLALANFIGLPVPINLVTIIICALAGIPGALLVILLFVLGILPKLAASLLIFVKLRGFFGLPKFVRWAPD
jgi:phosphatidylserine synthase